MTTNAKDYRSFGAGASNALELVRVVYDFSVDAGATGAINLLLASNKLIAYQSYVHVLAACTSGGSATVSIGVTGALTAIMDVTQGAVASLTTGYVQVGKAPALMASGAFVVLTIATAALTAGKIEVGVWACKAN